MRASTSGSAARGEQIDPTPTVFQPSVSATALPAYDPHAMFAEEVEAQQGPFGIRIDSVRLPSDPAVGLEVKVAAFSGAIPNVVEGDEARLFVDSVRSSSGQELLRTEDCGKERNAQPAKFSSTGSSGLRAEKTVRLLPGADPRTIQRVAGHVELHLPPGRRPSASRRRDTTRPSSDTTRDVRGLEGRRGQRQLPHRRSERARSSTFGAERPGEAAVVDRWILGRFPLRRGARRAERLRGHCGPARGSCSPPTCRRSDSRSR
jgi:hypothetical protein